MLDNNFLLIKWSLSGPVTAPKIKFSIEDFFRKCDKSADSCHFLRSEIKSKFSTQVMKNYQQTKQCIVIKTRLLLRPLLKRTKTDLLKYFLDAGKPFQKNGNGFIHIISQTLLLTKILQILLTKLEKA